MRILLLLVVIGLTGCAGAKLKEEWRTQRGYGDADISAIIEQGRTYHAGLATAYGPVAAAAEDAKLRTVFCNCWKKLGDRCRQKPDGLTGADKTLWIKANAVDATFASMETALDVATKVPDPDACPQ